MVDVADTRALYRTLGLKIATTRAGDGQRCRAGMTAHVRYTGRLVEDGPPFDTNADGEPLLVRAGRGPLGIVRARAAAHVVDARVARRHAGLTHALDALEPCWAADGRWQCLISLFSLLSWVALPVALPRWPPRRG